MPQYRIEVSPNNRATCKDTVCKKEQVKLLKGEIRFGTWVEINEHGSWSWKHWGCVSGAQLLHMREECDQGDGKYDFDQIDGFDELTDSNIQEKIRRCVKQAHIDPEDFNGDPEKNVPGEKGIHLTAKQKAAKEKAAAEANGDMSEEDAKPAKKAAKRGRKKGDEDEQDEPQAKKSKTAKSAKSPKSEDAAPAAKAGKTPRGKKSAVKDESEDEAEAPIPAKKSSKAGPTPKPTRGGKAAGKLQKKADTDEDEEAVSAPAKKDTAKSSAKASRKSAKKAAADESTEEEKPAATKRARRTSRSNKA